MERVYANQNPEEQTQEPEPWWCPTCLVEVPPEHVKNDETHDPNAGGCGNYVR